MSKDPYLEVKREVELNLGNTYSLLASHDRLLASHASPGGLNEARDEVRGTLSLLEADLEDLEESVRVVEETGHRWGIDEQEVRRRRAFVQRVNGEVKALHERIASMGTVPKSSAGYRYRDDPDPELDDDNAEAERWEREEQQVLINRQDDTLGVISGTLSTLASQAGLIGQEVEHQSGMLDDLSASVDSTGARLRKVQRTMQDFIRRNEETRSSWCIGILIVILMILLLAVILL